MADFVLNGIFNFNYKTTHLWLTYKYKDHIYDSPTETDFNVGNWDLAFLGEGFKTQSGNFTEGVVHSVYSATPYENMYISELDISAAAFSSFIKKPSQSTMVSLFKAIFAGDDDVTLGLGSDTINTFGGDDVIYGRGGADTILAGSGDDVIHGGAGMDVLTGEAGADIFVFDTKPSAKNVDKITDFSVKSDAIGLDHLIFRAVGKAGDLASSAFNIGNKAVDGSDRIIYNKNEGALYYDADGVGGVAAVKFAVLDKGLALTAGHFDIF